MAGRVEGKVAFISGAARGQGRSHAIRLAEEGADIIALDICQGIDTVPYELGSSDDLEQTIKEVQARGRRIVAREADVRDYDAVKSIIDEGVAELGRLDIAIGNAGILSFNRLIDVTSEQWHDMMDVNLMGPWHVAKAAAPHIIAGGRGGSIMLTSSAAGLVAYQNIGHYVAAKHGLVGLMKTLALELADDMIRVNTIHPINCNTPLVMNDPTFKIFSPHLENPTVDDFRVASQAGNALPVPWIEPSDITNAVLFLASDDARAITGATFTVDLGATIKKG